MPVQIRMNWTGGDTTVTIPVTATPQHAEFTVSHNVTSITFDPGTWLLCQSSTQVGVDEFAGPEPIADLVVSPNPFRTAANIGVGHRAKSIALKIYDASGRLVHSSTLGSMPSALSWNGVDQSGRSVPAGVYFVRAETATDRKAIKIIKID
jgi:hypothetical protein